VLAERAPDRTGRTAGAASRALNGKTVSGVTPAQMGDDDATGARRDLPQATKAASAPKLPVKGSAEISPRVM